MSSLNENILCINDLHVHFVTDEDTVKALNGVNLVLEKGDSLGLVGETGAGKTTTALSIMQLVPYPPGIITSGEIFFEGKDIILNSEKENQALRGNGISMIFQDPMTSLNPTMTIGKQLMEVVIAHNKVDKKTAEERVIEILNVVGVSKDRFNDYPHQFSGGMKQRVVIAMALLCNPKLLIADEPTTALDVTIQAQVLDIIKDLQNRYNMSLILITHDLGIVAQTCNKVAIMYAGEIVEYGSIRDVYKNAKHPYTRGLFSSIPTLKNDQARLEPIPGSTPNPANLPSGCPFHERCKYRQEKCINEKPGNKGDKHTYKCHFDLFSDKNESGEKL